MNTSYVGGQTTRYGELKPALLSGNGPTAYSVANGDVIYNPGSCDYLNAVSPCTTQSGNYNLIAVPTSPGNIRAGAPNPSQSGFTFRWFNSGIGGVVVVQNVAGSGMTPGAVAPLVFAGGTGGGASGFITVLTATTATITITKGGSYTVAPTATASSAATGGTAPTFTVTASTAVTQVADGTNLSLEVVQFGGIVSQL